jgi:hypothetical protein
MVSPGSAVFERELTQIRLSGTFLARYSAFVAWAISHVLNTKTVELLDTILVSQYQEMVVLPTVDAATPAGYRTEQALEYFQNEYLADDIATVVKAIKAYAEAKGLTKRATRNLLRNAISPDSRVLVRVPDELLAMSGKGAPKLKHPGFPFAEVGMTYEDRIRAQARTIATGMSGFQTRREAERNGEDLRWVTMRDDKVRPAHVHAQGQTVPYDEPFMVGNFPMWFPGDPAAPEDLTVNCRCVLATVPQPERRWVQRYVPAAWLNAALVAAGGPAQARAPKGSRIGGQWIDTPNAILRSLNRLESGTDLGENMRPVEEMKAERRRLAAEILEREGRPSLDETAARVTDIYDMTTPEQRAAGKAWYEESTGLAQEMVDNPATDLTMEQAAAAIAHLSTQTRWEANAEYARALAMGMDQDQALALLKQRIADGSVPRPRMGGDFLLGRNWEKAQSAMGHDNPVGDNSSFGTFTEKNKTRTFASNILGDQDGVTVDVHMQRVLGQSLKPVGKVKGLNQTYREDQIYESLAEAVRVAADARGVTPAEMQAITWTWALASHKPGRGGHPGRLVDATTGTVLPEQIGGLVAALDPLTPDTRSWDDEPMPDYHYAQAERLVGLPRQEAPELSPPVRADLTAAVATAPKQARAPKGTEIGGQWIDTPEGLRLSITGEGSPDGISGHERELVDWDSDEFRERATQFSEATGGGMDTPSEYCGYGPSYWAENAYKITGYGTTEATHVDVLPDGVTPMYRGLGAGREESEKFIDQYKNGDHFPGKGIFGAGSYFTEDRGEAGEYAGWLREQDGSPWSDHTDLIKSGLKPGARVLTIDNDKVGTDAENSHMWHLNNIRLATGGKEYIKGAGAIGGMNISRDIGAAAALAGYDAIHVIGLEGPGRGNYTVVLNRGATYVTEQNEVE